MKPDPYRHDNLTALALCAVLALAALAILAVTQ